MASGLPREVVNIGPRRSADVREVIGSNANDRAVSRVKLDHLVDDVPFHLLDDLRYFGASVEKRARVARQGVEIHIVQEATGRV